MYLFRRVYQVLGTAANFPYSDHLVNSQLRWPYLYYGLIFYYCKKSSRMVCPVKFFHNVTPTFSRLFLRVGTREQAENNRKVERHRNTVSKKKWWKWPFGVKITPKLPRIDTYWPETIYITPNIAPQPWDAQRLYRCNFFFVFYPPADGEK